MRLPDPQKAAVAITIFVAFAHIGLLLGISFGIHFRDVLATIVQGLGLLWAIRQLAWWISRAEENSSGSQAS